MELLELKYGYTKEKYFLKNLVRRQIKNNLSKLTTNEVNLNIKEVKKPETNSFLVAENIAQQLVKRISYRRAMKRSMQSCIRLGARGIKVSISGRPVSYTHLTLPTTPYV